MQGYLVVLGRVVQVISSVKYSWGGSSVSLYPTESSGVGPVPVPVELSMSGENGGSGRYLPQRLQRMLHADVATILHAQNAVSWHLFLRLFNKHGKESSSSRCFPCK